jgi:hypothetical protein
MDRCILYMLFLFKTHVIKSQRQGNNPTYLDLTECQTQMTWVWLACRLNSLRFSYVLWVASKYICVWWDYKLYHWVQLCVAPKYMWVWSDVKPNNIGFSYTLGLSTYGSCKMVDSISLSLATRWAQVHVGLAKC